MHACVATPATTIAPFSTAARKLSGISGKLRTEKPELMHRNAIIKCEPHACETLGSCAASIGPGRTPAWAAKRTSKQTRNQDIMGGVHAQSGTSAADGSITR